MKSASTTGVAGRPHQRHNPLNDTWVLVCPNRCQRPWQGQVHKEATADHNDDAEKKESKPNPLAPGCTRSNGQVNPMYDGIYIFNNDFPALMPAEEFHSKVDDNEDEEGLFVQTPVAGHCEVMCFHPRTDLTIPVMTVDQIKQVIDSWCTRLRELGKLYKWVQIFENKGQIMGCSNPHPHCQIWASDFLPQEPRRVDQCQKRYEQKYGKNLLLTYVEREMKSGIRVVVSNDHWAVVVPYWALWPFETILIPLTHKIRLTDLNDCERISLARIMKQLTIKYDNLFRCSFPYSMGFHGAPTGVDAWTDNDVTYSYWQLHAHYYPPLLRSASVQKYMVGYEMLAQPQRDLTPEIAADLLRSQCDVHYSEQKTEK